MGLQEYWSLAPLAASWLGWRQENSAQKIATHTLQHIHITNTWQSDGGGYLNVM